MVCYYVLEIIKERQDKEHMMETVSVIVPVYNVAGTLKACVKSIQMQSYDNLEIILVDDGSPDNSGEICDKLAQEDTRIKVIHQGNGGLPVARNSGIRVATGEYLCFVDSDDEIARDYVEELMSTFYKTGAELIVGGVALYGKTETTHISEPDSVFLLDDASYEDYLSLFSMWVMIPAWNKLFLKRIIVDNDIWFKKGLSCGEDGPFVFDYLRCCEKIAFVNKELYHYFVFRSNSANRFWPLEGQIEIFEQKCRFLEVHCKNDKSYVEKYRAKKSLHNIRDRINYLVKKGKEDIVEGIRCYDYYWNYVEPFMENAEIFGVEDWEWFMENRTAVLSRNIKVLYKSAERKMYPTIRKRVHRKLKKIWNAKK